MSDLVLQAEQLTKHYSDGLRDIEVLTDLDLAMSAGRLGGGGGCLWVR
jgi:hypothetical protein